jgi:hypothetical protein
VRQVVFVEGSGGLPQEVPVVDGRQITLADVMALMALTAGRAGFEAAGGRILEARQGRTLFEFSTGGPLGDLVEGSGRQAPESGGIFALLPVEYRGEPLARAAGGDISPL